MVLHWREYVVETGDREVSQVDAKREDTWYVTGMVEGITAALEEPVTAPSAIGDWRVVSGMISAS